MDKAGKEKLVAELRSMLVGKAGVFVSDYQGLNADHTYALRREFDKVGAGYRVVKNTLLRIAFKGTNYDVLNKDLKGTSAVAFADDPVAPAKVLAKAVKDYPQIKVRGGYVGGKRVEASDIDALSKLPGKDELRGMLLNVFNAPATSFVNVLAAGPRGLLNVLKARETQLEG